MEITNFVYCPCCAEPVAMRDAGFSATTVELEACSTLRAEGITSRTFRKSYAAKDFRFVLGHELDAAPEQAGGAP